MGQYYKAYLKGDDEKVFCPHNAAFMAAHGLKSADEIDRAMKSWDYDTPDSWGSMFDGLKLMEHAWMGNQFVNGVVGEIDGNPCAVAWVGDYADDPTDFDGRYTEDVYRSVWCEGGLPESPFSEVPENHPSGFLVNHTKGVFLDLAEYAKRATHKPEWSNGSWCIHPLPLLTAIGNDRGGGDYRSCHPNIGSVGCWAMDVIEYMRGRPGMPEVDYDGIVFKEG